MSNEQFRELRREAEEQLKEKTSRISGLKRSDLESLAHELAVHQEELEIQNEELRLARLAAEESRDRYLDLFDFAPVGYFTLDEYNRIVEANLTGCQLLRTERSDLLKKSFTKFMNADGSGSFYLQSRKTLESESRQTGELQMKKADGATFFAQIESLKVGSGRLRLAVIDVTERKETREKLARQREQLEAAYKELEDFNYSVSHDLKAPLRTLESFSKILLEDYAGKLDQTASKYLTYLREASQQMSRQIEDLLNLYHISRTELDLGPVNISDLTRYIAGELQASNPGRKVDFIIAPKMVTMGDRSLLRVLMENLLENSWKFTSRGSHTRIEVGSDTQNGTPVYFVKDNGVGFDMKYVDHLFAPFRHQHARNEFPGGGIGLTLCHRIILRHGGRIWAESEVGKGATFFFTIDPVAI